MSLRTCIKKRIEFSTQGSTNDFYNYLDPATIRLPSCSFSVISQYQIWRHFSLCCKLSLPLHASSSRWVLQALQKITSLCQSSNPMRQPIVARLRLANASIWTALFKKQPTVARSSTEAKQRIQPLHSPQQTSI